MNNVKFNFDGNSLVAEMTGTDEVIKYQLEMLVHNDINYLLSVKRQAVNNSLYLYFETVGKMSLDRLVIHKKLTDNAYLSFVKGTLNAVKELNEYQLNASGIVLDSRYIFINPTDYTPYFVYLPVKNNADGMSNLLSYLKNMIVSNMVEITHSGVMQKIINVLNSDMSVNEMLLSLESGSGASTAANMSAYTIPKPVENIDLKPAGGIKQSSTSAEQNVVVNSVNNQKNISRAVPNSNYNDNNKVTNTANIPENNFRKPVTKQKENEKIKKASVNQENKPYMKKIRPILMIISVIVIIIFGGLYSNGVFADSDGYTDSSVFIALPIFIFVIDYFVYSKLKKKYVISDENINRVKNEKKAVQKEKKEVFIPVTEVKKQNSNVNDNNFRTENPEFVSSPVSLNQEKFKTQINEQSFIDCGKTEVLAEDEIANPYLQSSGGNRVDINSSIMRIGKLREQVDVVISNPKVSRIHADIIVRDGKIFVMDLGSVNGTYINGNSNRITSNMEYELHNNDVVVFANEEYTVHC